MGEVPEVPSEEKTMAMLAHLLGIFTSFLGPLIIYLLKRDSKFVAFHSLQALFFQLGVLVVSSIASLLTAVLIGCLLLPLIWIGALVYVIIATVRSYNGEWFEYWLVGQWARRMIGG